MQLQGGLMNKYMKMAIEEARYGIHNGHGGPFGAVIIKDGAVIGKGHNRVLVNNDPTCHGEIEAIRDACKSVNSYDLSGTEIYVTGEPCPMCLGAILWANIAKIHYGCSIKENDMIGFRDEKFYNDLSISTDRINDRIEQLDHKDCLELFNEYKSIKDKKTY